MIRALLQRGRPRSLSFLAPGEAARAEAMRIPKRREDFLLGRWAAKRLIAPVVGCEARDVEVRAAPSGRPVAFVRDVPQPFCLSISHRDGLALAAMDDAPVGADLERVEPRSEAFVRDWFTPREIEDAAGDLFVNLIWSAKESALKALGVGLHADTRSVEIELLPAQHGAWQPFRVHGAAELPGFWRCEGATVMTIAGAGGPPSLAWGEDG